MARRAATLTLLAAAIAIGAWLRFDGLGEPSYWLDEILGQRLATSAATQPWWRWLLGFANDQGPLYFATQLVGSELVGRLVPALLGVATIAVVALCSARERFAAIIAALLLALSPLHVYYSREARPYALVMFLTAVLIALLLRDGAESEDRALNESSSPRVRGRAWLLAITLIALLYTHAAAAPVVAAAAVTAFLTKRFRLAIFAGVIAGAFLLLYRGGPPATPNAPFPADLFTTIARAMTVSALSTDGRGRAVVALLALAVIGAIALWRRSRESALIVIAMTLLPAALAIASLRWFGHWFAVRYVSAAIIGFVLLAGAGIVAAATFLARREVFAAALSIVIVVAIGRETWPAARTEPFRKLDWRAIAESLREHAKPGDVVLTAEPWSDVSLRYYLGDAVQVIPAFRVELAEMLMRRGNVAWLVSAGYASDASVRGWMCRYPVVMSSALESFRLHYAGSRRELLMQRAKPAELRAAAASFRSLAPGDELFFGEGWADAEDGFRWAAAKRATVFLPRFGRRDGVIRMTALPLPPQSMRVSLNGTTLGTIALANDWREYAVAAPAAAWIDGVNTLTLEFARATSPGPNDPRTLAACFESIAVDASTKADRPLLPSLRIDADRFIDAKSVWRNTRTRFPAARLHRRNVEALLGRLGFDPASAWPRLASGDVHLDDVVETVAYGSDCEDDGAFLRRAFAILLERRPNELEERDLLARLRAGASREVIVGRIAKSGDFRALALSFAPR